MAQINFHTTAAFDADLAMVTKALNLGSKSAAIRLAVHEIAEVLRARAARKNAAGEAVH